jgi:hypothetical protein
LESQRVKLLLKGYQRGWLDFKYVNKTSKLRENLILYSLENEAYEDALSHKLMIDAALIGGSANKTRELLNSLDKTYKLYIGLKLPDLAPKDTIKDASTMTDNTLQEYKKLLADAQATMKVKKPKNG